MKLKFLFFSIITVLILSSCGRPEAEKFRTHDFYTIDELMNGDKDLVRPLLKPELIKVCSGRSYNMPNLPNDIKIAQYSALTDIYPTLRGGSEYSGLPNGVLLENENWKDYEKKFESGAYGNYSDIDYWSRADKIVLKIQSICEDKALNDNDIKLALESRGTNSSTNTIGEDKLYQKFSPILELLNKKANKYGYGTYKELIQAKIAANSLIESGAQYSLTGVQQEVQRASCDATLNSTWVDGNPGGYWSCFIDFIGSSDFYSIEFSGQKWSGRIGSAGKLIDWKTTVEFDSWFLNNMNKN